LDTGDKSYEIKVTEKAKKIFSDAPEKYIRVGANPGGCSGWRWTLESTDEKKVDDEMFENEYVIINKDILTNVIGSITIDYQDKDLINQGFIFITNSGQCGCGESFQPINPIFNAKTISVDV
jgi:iron-sulfur cluster assembly protein